MTESLNTYSSSYCKRNRWNYNRSVTKPYFWVFLVFYELYVWLYAYSCSILRCFQLINYSFLSVSRFRAKNDCSYSFWVFRLNFMLNFVYIFQAIVIFLTGIVSLILAKLELFFVNFKSISNIKWSYMSGSHMTYIVYKLTKLCFFDNFMVSFVNFSRSHDYKNFPCCFHDKNGCYAMCYVIVSSSSCTDFKKLSSSLIAKSKQKRQAENARFTVLLQ